MQIILAGCGKVGMAIVHQLSGEGHSITVIDTNPDKVGHITEAADVLGVTGNCASIGVLQEAGVETADVFIAVTGSDELNLLCCMFAKKAGHCHAVARVRNPAYSRELEFIRKQMGISSIINPELAAAMEISRLLRHPAARKIDTFADGRVRLVKFVVDESCKALHGVALKHIPAKLGSNVLICAVERGQEVVIPGGDFVFRAGDVVSFVATQEQATDFFGKLGMATQPVGSALIVGGGTIGYYLARDLLEHGVPVRIIEKDPARCDFLAEQIPEAQTICGDGADRDQLLTEGIENAGGFVALTNLDEENVLLGLYARKHNPTAKIVTKVNRLEFDDVLETLDLGSVIYPKYMTTDYILQYVRAMQNEAGSNIKTLYRILDDRVEALEFGVQEKSAAVGVPLHELKLKPHTLVCCMIRGEEIIIPRGNDCIQVGDTVIVVTLEQGWHDVRDILAR